MFEQPLFFSAVTPSPAVLYADESPLNDLDESEQDVEQQLPDPDQLIESLENADEALESISDPAQV